MPEGFEVASEDLRKFASAMEVAGQGVKPLAGKVHGADLDFHCPVVGLGFKSTYAGIQENVRSAITAVGEAWETAGRCLREIANDYEAKERSAAKSLTPHS